jgi:hypothetical protein
MDLICMNVQQRKTTSSEGYEQCIAEERGDIDERHFERGFFCGEA